MVCNRQGKSALSLSELCTVVHNNYMPFRQYHIVARWWPHANFCVVLSYFEEHSKYRFYRFSYTGVRLFSRIGDFILDGISVVIDNDTEILLVNIVYRQYRMQMGNNLSSRCGVLHIWRNSQ
jgi:hypothetical protein